MKKLAGMFWRYWYGVTPWRARFELDVAANGDYRAEFGSGNWSMRELGRLALIAGL